MALINVHGFDISYDIDGESNENSLVLIHGLMGSKQDWNKNRGRLLALGFTVVAIDLPGHGASYTPTKPKYYDIRKLATVMHDFTTTLGLAPSVIVGHSMGGAVAEEWSLQFPEDVRALILVNTAGLPEYRDSTPTVDKLYQQERIIALKQGMEAAWNFQQENGLWASVTHLDVCEQKARKEQFCLVSAYTYAYGSQACESRRSTIKDFETFTKPALIICGENDRSVFKKTAESITHSIQNSRLIIIPNSGHSPHYENAIYFNKEVESFISTLPDDSY
ncbi:MAG: alpha/beta hydrolase [Chloroflexota bacterium]